MILVSSICMVTMPLPKKIPAELRTFLSPSNGRVVGNRYGIEKKLGTGNYGTAYLVQDLKSNKEWKVLKEILVGSLEADDTTDAVQEAKLLSKLNHPGIVRFKDSFLAGEFFCIVTEYCEGGDLGDKINMWQKEQRMFSESLVLDWFIQLMLGIQYMHEQRVLHRDLKTRNIFLKNNMIKIGDFGISRIMMGTSDLASTFIGTPYYMSPEVIRHAGYNSKSDIWSAGCILYEMCALRHAFDGTGLMGVMFAIVEGAMPKLPDKYSSSLADVLETMLRKDPAKRVSASEVLRIPYIAKHMQSLKQKMDQTRARGEGAAMRPGGEGAAKTPGREGAERRPGREGAERRPGGEGVVKRPGGEGALRRPSGEGAPGRPGGDGAPGRLGGEGEPGRPRGDGAARRFGWEGRGGGAVAALTPMQRLQRKKQREADEAARQLSEAAAHNYSQNKERVQRLRTAQLSERPPWVEEHPEVFNSTAFQPQLPPSQQTRRGDSRAPPGRDSDDSDGIPEDPQLADTYYSQYDDFESSEGDDSDDEEEEIAEEPEVKKDDDRRGNRPGGHHRDDYGRLIHHMENALNLDASSGTFGDDVTVSQDTRIRNLKRQCDVVLGAEAFKKVYSYLRSARFQSSVSVTDEQVIRQLKRYCKNPADCFLVEQLLFLEEQARIDKL